MRFWQLVWAARQALQRPDRPVPAWAARTLKVGLTLCVVLAGAMFGVILQGVLDGASHR